MCTRYTREIYYPGINKLYAVLNTRLILGMLPKREILPGKDS